MIYALTFLEIILLIGSGILFTIGVGAMLSNDSSLAGWILYFAATLFMIFGGLSIVKRDVLISTDVEITEYRVDTTKVISNNDTTYVYTLNFERK